MLEKFEKVLKRLYFKKKSKFLNNNLISFYTLLIKKTNDSVPPCRIRYNTDRGSQFTSFEYKEALERLGITHSMSRVGKCIDNGPMEGFFGNIKSEKYYLNNYETLEELKNDISDYIRFYNEKRL